MSSNPILKFIRNIQLNQIALFALGLGLGVFVSIAVMGPGFREKRTSDSPPARQAAPRSLFNTPRAAGGLHSMDELTLRSIVRDAVRDELQALKSTNTFRDNRHKKQRAETEKKEIPEKIKEQRREAYARAERIITEALTFKNWNENNAREFQFVLSRLAPEQQEKLLSRLIPAINRGLIKVSTRSVF